MWPPMAPTKKSKEERIQIRVTNAEKRKLKEIARRAGKTMTELFVSTVLEAERRMDRAA